MPDFPPVIDAPRRNDRLFSVGFLCAGGDQASVGLDGIATSVTGAELANLRTAVGNLSNGSVVGTTYSETVSVSPTTVTPLDESYSEASTKLVLVFQDANQDIVSIAIPAPDESFFGQDGVTIITPDTGAAAGTPARVLGDSIANIRSVLNGGIAAAPAGTYALLRGYRSKRAGKLPKPRMVRASGEPGAGTLPPAEPGT